MEPPARDFRGKVELSRQIGIPLTRSGRQRKVGAAMGCTLLLAMLALLLGMAAAITVMAVRH